MVRNTSRIGSHPAATADGKKKMEVSGAVRGRGGLNPHRDRRFCPPALRARFALLAR